jgi:hypothetical protein
MSFYVEDKGGDFERCPPGAHLARCYRVIDLGNQKSEYMGQVKYLHKIMIRWEIHSSHDNGEPIKMKDGRPFSVHKNYTLSWSEKANLRIDLQSWRGKQFVEEETRRFDLKTLLNVWCMLNVIDAVGKDGKTYNNIKGITPVPSSIKQIGLPAPVNKNEFFMISDPDMVMFETFSENLKKKITSSPQWQKRNAPQNSAPEPLASYPDQDDDIPF